MPYSLPSDIVPNRISAEDVARLCTDDTSVTDAQVLAAVADPSSATGSPLAVVAAVIAAIAKADPMIESYCAKRYVMPFSPVPDSIKDVSADMACYFMYMRRPSLYEGSMKTWRDAFTSATGWLKDISTGKAVIEGAVSPIENSAETNSSFTADERIFTRHRMRGL